MLVYILMVMVFLVGFLTGYWYHKRIMLISIDELVEELDIRSPSDV